MWKKDEMEPSTPNASAQDQRVPGRESARRASTPSERATIGPSITIRGEVSGDEDILIQGNVEGSVDLKQHSVTVGREGRVKADITGRVVTVEGRVEGDLIAQEQVILRSSAHVQGDLTAPRVVLEDGATFRGLVDMGDASPRGGRAAATAGTQSSRETASSTGSGDASKDADKSSSSSSSAKTSSRTDKDTSDKASSRAVS
ncbi:MAG: polymer-forming cytoskeletal protein [Gemmatimonadetes bacterium]|nr:polymer-forming cytoskeletal protein [Gemmatimonadota bacterium]